VLIYAGFFQLLLLRRTVVPLEYLKEISRNIVFGQIVSVQNVFMLIGAFLDLWGVLNAQNNVCTDHLCDR
jgi:hypothetical protein